MSVKPCCQDTRNLRESERRDDLVVRTCIVCGCRHFEVTLDPGHIGVTVATLG